MTSKIGIIGDKVGAGKSYVILSLVLSPLPLSIVSSMELETYANNTLHVYKSHGQRVLQTSLIVVPHNLTVQWEAYICAFMPVGTRYIVVNRGRALDRLGDINDYDVIVVTNTFYNAIAVQCDDVRWKRVIFDEVDSLKVNNCSAINASSYWFVTASYNNLLYPHGRNVIDASTGRFVKMATGLRQTGFVRNMFLELSKELDPAIVQKLVLKNRDSFVDESTDLQPVKETVILCKKPQTINILEGLVDAQIIHHLNANDVSGAMALIGSQQVNSEKNIIGCLVKSMERKVGNIELKIEYVKALHYESENVRDSELSRLEIAKASLARKIKTIGERISSTGTCSVCYNVIGEEEGGGPAPAPNANKKCVVPCCSNAFCFCCISKWVAASHSCPLCKSALSIGNLLLVGAESTSQLLRLHDDDELDGNVLPPKKTKLETLNELLATLPPNRKIIIFSAYDSSFDSIVPLLRQRLIAFDYLRGPGSPGTVRRFKEGNQLNLLLVNTTHFGSGLNLENTTDVIMFHRFDSEVERQVIGRAQRPGRVERLNVWYLLHENE